MSDELQAALLGLGGALVGAWIGAKATYTYAAEQNRTQLTLRMFEQYQSLLRHRIAADALLSARKKGGKAIGYKTLYTSLQESEWQGVSYVRHFWGQLALLKCKGHLDSDLAKSLFGEDAHYWWFNYFRDA